MTTLGLGEYGQSSLSVNEFHHNKMGSQDNVVSIVTTSCTGWSRFWFLAVPKILRFSKISRPDLGATQLPVLQVSSEGNWLGYEVDHSTSTSAKVKNEWNCISTPPVCLQGVDKDIFTLTTCRWHWHRVLRHINSHYAAKVLGSRATKDDILLVPGSMFLLATAYYFSTFQGTGHKLLN
jgi:hypothetical protein